MLRKLTLHAIAAGVLVALAAPGSASAEAIVTNSLGEPAVEVEAVSEDSAWMASFGAWNCDTVRLTLSLTQNDTETASAVGSGTVEGATGSHAGSCRIFPSGTPFTYTSATAELHLEDEGEGTANVYFAYKLGALLIPCSFSGTLGVQYVSGTNEIQISGLLTGGGYPGCHSSGTFAASFGITEQGEPIELMG